MSWNVSVTEFIPGGKRIYDEDFTDYAKAEKVYEEKKRIYSYMYSVHLFPN